MGEKRNEESFLKTTQAMSYGNTNSKHGARDGDIKAILFLFLSLSIQKPFSFSFFLSLFFSKRERERERKRERTAKAGIVFFECSYILRFHHRIHKGRLKDATTVQEVLALFFLAHFSLSLSLFFSLSSGRPFCKTAVNCAPHTNKIALGI